MARHFWIQTLIACVVCVFFLSPQNGNAQDSLRDLYPQAFEYPHTNNYLNDAKIRRLRLNPDQDKEARALYQAHFERRPSFDVEVEIEYQKNLYRDYSVIMNESQLAELEQIMVFGFFEQEAKRQLTALANKIQSGPVPTGGDAILLVPDVIEFLEIDDRQQERVHDSIVAFGKSRQAQIDANNEAIENMYNEWQTKLLDELLDFQKSDFKKATGKEFEFPKSLERIQMHANYNGPQFLESGKSVSSYSSSPPQEIDLILNTPFYLDAHMHPAGMFALLLAEETTKELKLTASQVKQLETQHDRWGEAFPLPKKLVSNLVFGRNMTPKSQRETAEASNEQFGKVETEALEVLTSDQQTRLQQIWNQFVLSMGWYQVPLTFPDWRDYLELSVEQKKAFDEINVAYKKKVLQLAVQLSSERKDAEAKYRSEMADLLTPEQAQKLKRVLGVKFEKSN